MTLDQNILEQLRGIFAQLEQSYTLLVENDGSPKGAELLTLARDLLCGDDLTEVGVQLLEPLHQLDALYLTVV